MNFYHLEEYIKLLKRQRLEREIFLANGFDDEAINELFALIAEVLKVTCVFTTIFNHICMMK